MGSLSLATATKARHWLPTYRRIAADAQYNRQSHHRIAGAIIDRQPWPSSSAEYDAAWSRATDKGRQHLRSNSSLRGRRRRRFKHDAAPTICIAHGLCWRSGLVALDADAIPAHTKSPDDDADASRRRRVQETKTSRAPRNDAAVLATSRGERCALQHAIEQMPRRWRAMGSRRHRTVSAVDRVQHLDASTS